MIVHISRIICVVTGALGGMAVSRLVDLSEQIGFPQYFVIIVFIILGSLIGYVLGGIFGRELALAYGRAEEKLHEMVPTDVMLGSIGLILGLLTGLLIGYPLRLAQPRWLSFVSQSALLAILAYVGVRVALLKRANVARAFHKLNDPADRSGVGHGARAVVKYLDTSAVIDGRFAELARIGFLEGELRVPRFVLAELQTLADSADDVRRARGRRGLDLLATLQSEGGLVEVFELDYPDTPSVDGKLVRLAEDTGGAIVTVDYNLTKVARVQDVETLNLNDVATAVRPAFLPGELLELRVLKPGKEEGQGVGYLDDGTMVVIQGGRDHVGEDIEVEVTSVLQTSAGRMVFTKTRPPA